MEMQLRILIIPFLLSSVFAMTATPSYAGGFYLQEQSAKETGRAFSGGAASADNASTVFFNPAAMTELEDINIDIGGNIVFVNSRQSDNNSLRTVPGHPNTVPTAGSDGGNPFDQPIVIPSTFVTAQVSDSIWLGLGLSSPFGIVVEYDDNFFGRYDSIRSDVFTINIQPSFAVKLSENLSIGGGIDIQYIDVELTSAVPNLSPLQPDGAVNVTGDDWSVGWNAGIFGKVGPVQLGAHYRSRMKHNLSGQYSVSGLSRPLTAGNVELPTTAPITLPDIATFSATFGVNKSLRFHGTLRWYNWTVFDKIEILPVGLDPVISRQNYQDTWSTAFGLDYDIAERLTLRAGTMYDETPTNNALRTTRVPDGDRTWLTLGATYDVTDNIAVNLSYAHIFVSTEQIDRTDGIFEGSPAAIAATVRSTNRGDADIIGFSASARF
ncbi:MAG: porin [Roseovarius sp.]|jgi:long-chain fatty acid transport protein|nr:porin [Roseovarius sp.]